MYVHMYIRTVSVAACPSTSSMHLNMCVPGAVAVTSIACTQSMQYLRRQQHCRYHQRNPFVDTLSLLRHVARCCPFPVCPPWSLGRHRLLKILPSARFIVIVFLLLLLIGSLYLSSLFSLFSFLRFP